MNVTRKDSAPQTGSDPNTLHFPPGAVMSTLLGAVISAILSLSACSDPHVVDTQTASKGPATLRVITFNIMCSTACEKPKEHDLWKDRLPHLRGLLGEYDADIVGLQELMPRELALHAPDGDEPTALMPDAPEYVPLYWQATDSDAQFSTYPDATIYLRKSRFSVKETGSYWLGPTPDKPLSSGYLPDKPSLPRLVFWARAHDNETGKELYIANTHFDANTPNQEHSAVDFMKRLPSDRGVRERAVITGDFNVDPSRDAFKTLTAKQADGVGFTESHDLAAKTEIAHNDATEPAYDPSERIDHVFVGPAWRVQRWLVDMRRFGDKKRYPSDHFLILADLVAN